MDHVNWSEMNVSAYGLERSVPRICDRRGSGSQPNDIYNVTSI